MSLKSILTSIMFSFLFGARSYITSYGSEDKVWNVKISISCNHNLDTFQVTMIDQRDSVFKVIKTFTVLLYSI